MQAATIRPERTGKRIALALQGGGAIGAFQAGILEVLHEENISIDACCASSIGAINAALFFGNHRSERLERLQAFWNGVSIPGSATWTDLFARAAPLVGAIPAFRRTQAEVDQAYALSFGLPGFFARRGWVPWVDGVGDPSAAALCDTTPLKRTLEMLCDFSLLNESDTQLSVVAANVETGKVRYFDNGSLSASAIMASGALPPWFPAVEVDGAWYWDGSLVTGTPLRRLIETAPSDGETVILRADLWASDGPMPDNMTDVDIRHKNIEQASRAAFFDEAYREAAELRTLLAHALDRIDPERISADPQLTRAKREVRTAAIEIIPVAYPHSQSGTHFKDVQFGQQAIAEHWENGRRAAHAALERIAACTA
ncbi:patatin-like phospholipase family protein [Trinickia diaoshuihuensis]|uniref:patatin-like phospholipase family protein n=1 Tax=Trinickia diaoshuihuensis TaxID=2292265 RepID=UPI000E271788|nr:patatin-like phospholipase family protein [Trinickia diaoshuihuensis]